jgi:hypothetical protein
MELNMTTEEAMRRIGKIQRTLMKLTAQLEGVKINLMSESMPDDEQWKDAK